MEKFLVRGRKCEKDREYFEGYLRIGPFSNSIQNPKNGNKKRVFKESLQRYTGKIDKYARKIFEGDVVRLKDNFAFVEYSEQNAKFQFIFWMNGKAKDFEEIDSQDVVKVGNTLVNETWLNFKGNIFVDFTLAFEFLEETKRSLVDQTRLVIVTMGTVDHKEMRYRDVYIYDESKMKVLAYITPEIFKILEARGLITSPTQETIYSSRHIYIGNLVKKRKTTKKDQKEENTEKES